MSDPIVGISARSRMSAESHDRTGHPNLGCLRVAAREPTTDVTTRVGDRRNGLAPTARESLTSHRALAQTVPAYRASVGVQLNSLLKVRLKLEASAKQRSSA